KEESTLSVRQETDPGMLPQSQALESVPADTAGVATKRGTEVEADSTPGVQHGRGEMATSGGRVTTEPAGEVAGGVVPAPARVPQPRVFVLDKHKRPLQPMRPDRARKLLDAGRARVHRRAPFVIRMVDVDARTEEVIVDGVEVGIDPGAKATGIAVFTATGQEGARQGIWLGELVHRG